MINRVIIASQAQKALRRIPRHIVDKLFVWVNSVKLRGLEEVRKLPGFHDEGLKGQREGQRSIRLNRAYRAIYVVGADETAEFVSVEEVHKHDY